MLVPVAFLFFLLFAVAVGNVTVGPWKRRKAPVLFWLGLIASVVFAANFVGSLWMIFTHAN